MQWICLLILSFNLPQTSAPCHAHTEARLRSQSAGGIRIRPREGLWAQPQLRALDTSLGQWDLGQAGLRGTWDWPYFCVAGIGADGSEGDWNGLLGPEQGWGSPRKCWVGTGRAGGACTVPLLGEAGTVKGSQSYWCSNSLDPDNREHFWPSCMQMFDYSPSEEKSRFQL